MLAATAVVPLPAAAASPSGGRPLMSAPLMSAPLMSAAAPLRVFLREEEIALIKSENHLN